MARASKPPTLTEAVTARLHRAARLEDWFHGLRQRWGRSRGLVPSVVPFTGYGSTGWVRVLCRIQLGRQGASATKPLVGRRGWRSFTGIQVAHAAVTIRAGRATREVNADRGGVVDVRIEVKL